MPAKPNAQPAAPEEAAARPAAPRLAGGAVGKPDSNAALQRLTGALAELRAHAVQPMLQQAIACLREDRHKEGGDWAIRALEVDEKNAHAWHLLAIAREKATDYTSALNAYEKALQLDPEVFERRNSHGVLLQERNVQERAKFHFYMAKTYAKAGATERALLYMRKALEEGFKERDKFREDPEFASLQELPEFQQLLALEPRVL